MGEWSVDYHLIADDLYFSADWDGIKDFFETWIALAIHAPNIVYYNSVTG